MKKSTLMYFSGLIEVIISIGFAALVAKVVMISDKMSEEFATSDFIIILMLTLIIASTGYTYWCSGIDKIKMARDYVEVL